MAALRAANAGLRQVIEAKDAQIAALLSELGKLQAQVADLSARVKASSKNSSKPPSSDGPGKPAPKSLRKKTGRGPGRPKGQPGATMELTDHPDHVIRHEPSCCSGCGAGLDGAPGTGAERRQVTEIPPVKAEVTEHQLVERQCGGCGTRTRGAAPDGVSAPVQYGPRAAALGTYLWHGQFLSRGRAAAAMAEMSGCAPSPAVIAAMARKIAGLVSPAIEVIITALAAAEVAHSDETGFRVAGRLAWVHSASSGKYVLVTVHAKRGKEAVDAAGVLPSFAGIACHDAWKPYDSYDGVAGHALCCSHVLRELVAVTETGTSADKIWIERGSLDQAYDHLERALRVFRDHKHQHLEAEALVLMSDLSLRRGELTQAAVFSKQSLAISRRIDYSGGITNGLMALGQVSLQQGDYQQAISYLQQALTQYRQDGAQYGEIFTLRNLAEALHGAGQPAAAFAELETALSLATETGNTYQQASIHRDLAESHHRDGQDKQARHHWQQALTLYTQLGAPEADQIRSQIRSLPDS